MGRIVNQIKYIDLFAGAGGWDAGIRDLGWGCLGMYEWNKSACETLRYNHNSPVYEVDLSRYQEIDFPQVDVVIGSPPCQGFSNEGKSNSLVWDFLQIVECLQPQAWIFENVPGFKRLYKGEYHRELIKRVAKMGYTLTSNILDASDYGVPQKRKRFIALGYKDQTPTLPKAMFGEIDRDLRPKRTLWEAISDLPVVPHGEKIGIFGYPSDPLNDYQRLLRKYAHQVTNHTTQNHSPRVLEKIKRVPMGGNMSDIVGTFEENKKHYEGGYRRAKKSEPSFTAYWTRGMTSIHPELHRFLSPRECARIQSFPDDIIFQGTTIQHYTQICNAVPPLLAYTLCDHIQSEVFGGSSRA